MMHTMPRTQFDSVSGISTCGGIPRMEDDFCAIIAPPSPRTVDRRSRRAAAHAKFQFDAAAAAKSARQRIQYATNVSYVPATNPLFSKYVQDLIDAIAIALPNANANADTAPSDIVADQIPTFVYKLQSLRIRLIVNPTPPTIDELRELCEEASRNESIAYATAYAEPPRTSFPTDIADYYFMKQMRTDLEAELSRCKKRSFGSSYPVPTAHVRIASSTMPWIGTILSLDTLRRTFISIHALIVAVSDDIKTFMTCPSRGAERVAFVVGEPTPATELSHAG